MAMAHRILSIAFAIIWCGSLYYDVAYQPRLGHDWYIYKLVMLTNLNFVIITIFAVFALAEVLSIADNHLKPFLDFSFYCTIFPVAVTTCALFWGLYAIDPELVMPEWVARLIPSWLNHVTHTLPVIYVVFDLLTAKRSPPSHRKSLTMAALHVFIYFVIIIAVRVLDGYWLYPLLELLSLQALAAMFLAAIVGYYGLIRLAAVLSKFGYGIQEPMKSKRPRKVD
ncbi:FAR-17a/AIG1-like protein [Ancylostoma caninum]|uniref:FAR-17a/AIG1-like protein n=1 Tax=Ancylostoma caninum TaxID=29170 RepID=A0A368GMC1_ANCCA|nr:FAR-17a/AIG1-like protein [Ancylostoma caninum]